MATRKTMLTAADIRQRLANAIDKEGSQLAWATKFSISHAHVNAVLHGRQNAGPAIMRALGINPTPHYELEHRDAETFQQKPAAYGITDWAGTRYYRVTIIGETKRRYRVRMEQNAKLPGRNRSARRGDVLLMPKDVLILLKSEDDEPKAYDSNPTPAAMWPTGSEM